METWTPDWFWSLIEASRREELGCGEPEAARRAQLERFRGLLGDLPIQEAVDFAHYFRIVWESAGGEEPDRLRTLVSEVAWGTPDDCSEGGWDDFRSWLVSMGRRVYETVVRDPTTLPGVVERAGAGKNMFFELFQYVPKQVVAARSGRS